MFLPNALNVPAIVAELGVAFNVFPACIIVTETTSKREREMREGKTVKMDPICLFIVVGNRNSDIIM